MLKRLCIIILFMSFSSVSVFADDFEAPDNELLKGIDVIFDCISTSLLGKYVCYDMALPSSSVAFDSKTGLPQRISYFLADPFDFLIVLNDYASTLYPGFRNQLFQMVRNRMLDKNYYSSGYSLTGTVVILYPDKTDILTLLRLFDKSSDGKENDSENCVKLCLDINLSGAEMKKPLSISGIFNLYADADGLFITAADDYEVNHMSYKEGTFRY